MPKSTRILEGFLAIDICNKVIYIPSTLDTDLILWQPQWIEHGRAISAIALAGTAVWGCS